MKSGKRKWIQDKASDTVRNHHLIIKNTEESEESLLSPILHNTFESSPIISTNSECLSSPVIGRKSSSKIKHVKKKICTSPELFSTQLDKKIIFENDTDSISDTRITFSGRLLCNTECNNETKDNEDESVNSQNVSMDVCLTESTRDNCSASISKNVVLPDLKFECPNYKRFIEPFKKTSNFIQKQKCEDTILEITQEKSVYEIYDFPSTQGSVNAKEVLQNLLTPSPTEKVYLIDNVESSENDSLENDTTRLARHQDILNISMETPCSGLYEIESIPSQLIESKQDHDHYPCTSSNSGSVKPEKKKRHKKGGYASQVAKTLKQQQNHINIWKHELLLSKINDYVVPCAQPELIKLFVIQEIKIEFGRKVALCNSDGEKSAVFLSDFVDTRFLYKGKKFKLYPKYVSKVICFEGVEMNCYINANKIKFCEPGIN